MSAGPGRGLARGLCCRWAQSPELATARVLSAVSQVAGEPLHPGAGAWLGRGRRRSWCCRASCTHSSRHTRVPNDPISQVRKLRHPLAQHPAVSRQVSVGRARAAPAPSPRLGSAQPRMPSWVIAGETKAKWPRVLPGHIDIWHPQPGPARETRLHHTSWLCCPADSGVSTHSEGQSPWRGNQRGE